MARGALVAAAMAALAVVVLVLCMAPEARAAVEFSDKDLATEDSAWALYELWIAHHKVARDGAEKTRRFRVFKDNLRRVRELHERDRSYKLAMNNFGDMTDDEVSAAYGCEDLADDGGGEDQDQDQGGFAAPASGDVDDLPKTVDWRSPGYDQRPAAVTDVKDQGAFCECCWAFTAVACVEGLFSIRRRILTTLSAQQLVDCDTMDKGCNGGLAARAFRYITNNGGLAGEASYPYMGLNHSCRKPMSPFVELNGLLRVKAYSEVDLRKAVAAQPVAVSVDPGRPGTAFKRYTGGIFQGPCGNNSSSRRGHAMALIGYATDESGDDYWILKNSWSDEWGEHGYMRLKRDKNELGTAGTCGILRRPVYPLMR